ncbi:MAG: hypothetical protein WBL49_08810 [Nitrososphaeraceae archaeon]
MASLNHSRHPLPALGLCKTETTTFRFDSETMKSLRDEAKQKDISTNTLLNQIVKVHLKWHANASNAGFIAVRRLLITSLISHLSEQEIISVAENVAKNTNKDTILLLENEYTMKSALDFIENWIKISGYKYKHHEINDGQSRHMYLIQHDMGIKWSIYLTNLYQFLFDDVKKDNKRKIEIEKTENTLAFTVDVD